MEYVEPVFCITDPNYYLQRLIAEYESITGRTLNPADPERLFINNVAYGFGLMSTAINESAKQNLLKFARGVLLDYIGDPLGCHRLVASPAITTLRFYLETAMPADTIIPEGTIATNGTISFATTAEAIIPEGELEISVAAECTVTGVAGNDYVATQINQLTNPAVYLVENTTTTNSGADIEDDEHYRDRIRLAPETFSVAGPKGAYEYWAKTANANIIDVSVTSPDPGDVWVYFLMENGELPTDDLLPIVLAILDNDKTRPLTDNVAVKKPTQANYTIEFTWYIYPEYSALETSIATLVQTAVDNYVLWQKSKLGLDINPSYLIGKLMNIEGIKRIELVSPESAILTETQVAHDTEITINAGGVEDE